MRRTGYVLGTVALLAGLTFAQDGTPTMEMDSRPEAIVKPSLAVPDGTQITLEKLDKFPEDHVGKAFVLTGTTIYGTVHRDDYDSYCLNVREGYNGYGVSGFNRNGLSFVVSGALARSLLDHVSSGDRYGANLGCKIGRVTLGGHTYWVAYVTQIALVEGGNTVVLEGKPATFSVP